MRCPHCGEINWEIAPGLHEVFLFIAKRKETVNADVRRKFRLSPQNTSNRLRGLEQLGVIARVRSETTGHGGSQVVYEALGDEKLGAVTETQP